MHMSNLTYEIKKSSIIRFQIKSKSKMNHFLMMFFYLKYMSYHKTSRALNDKKIGINIGVAPTTQLRTCAIKIVTFKGGRLMW